MSQEQLLYPRGRIAMSTGDLIDVTNVKFEHTNNAKQVHTIVQKGAGIVQGNTESTVTFDMVVSEQGLERDYYGYLQNGLIKQVRLKIPGSTFTINGMVKQISAEIPLDDAIKVSITFIGKKTEN